MSDGLNCLSLMREKKRVEIRKKRNEETFYRNRNQTLTDLQEIMKYLEFRNEDLQIDNLKEFIDNKSQHFYECALLSKWLLDYDKLEYSQSGIQIYLFCQNEIALNFESKYIQKAAQVLRKLSLTNETALALCTKLSSHTTLRSQLFIQELQSHDYIDELIYSQFEAQELICNLMYGESFLLSLFEKDQKINNYFRSQLFNQRYSSQVILMYQSISYSSKICDLITTKELIFDLMQINPTISLFQLLLKMSKNTEIFYNYIDIQFIDYIMEMIDNQELQEVVLKLIYIILVQTSDLYLIVALQQSKNIIEQISKTKKTQLNEIANEILDLYINNS